MLFQPVLFGIRPCIGVRNEINFIRGTRAASVDPQNYILGKQLFFCIAPSQHNLGHLKCARILQSAFGNILLRKESPFCLSCSASRWFMRRRRASSSPIPSSGRFPCTAVNRARNGHIRAAARITLALDGEGRKGSIQNMFSRIIFTLPVLFPCSS